MMNELQTPNMPSYLQGLNPEQRQAVETTEGPLLVLAGAGTGKTRVLTTRLAHIIHSFRAQPQEILAVTFTNKAAAEMKHRVAEILNTPHIDGWWLGTFHALAARMLRRHADLVGLTSQFTIIDTDDQIRLLKQLLEAQSIDTKKNAPKLAAHIIGGWKDKALNPDQVTADMAGDAFEGKLHKIYAQYQARLRILNTCDFGDLLLHIINIFKNPEHEFILSEYQRRFRYIMVDEYQDTNTAQYLWLRLLAKRPDGSPANIACVGDDDQSIYGWRGAEVGNILRFERDFEGASIIKLEQNYRSTNHILRGAGGVISQNESRLGKELWSESGDGEKIMVHGLWDGEAEARWVGEKIEDEQRKGTPLNEISVLVRAGYLMREFEDRFISLGLPYQVIGGARFYERMEIRDALAYLRVTANAEDSLALERVINTPKRGIGQATVQTLNNYARQMNISLHESILQLCQTDEIKPKQSHTLLALTNDFSRWRRLIGEGTPHPEIAETILDESGYTDMWKADKSVEAQGRLENLKELINAMAEYENLGQFLEHVALVLDNNDDRSQAKISIMTLHGAKGLEFDCVFLPGWEEGLFPSQKSMDEKGLSALEEERRLAYVGITRAKKRCHISFVSNRRTYGQWVSCIPSRFVDEIPDAHVEASNDTGIGSGGRSSHWDSTGNRGSWSQAGGSFDSEGFAAKRVQSLARNIHSSKIESANTDGVRSGQRVMHPKFGEGKIIHVDGQKLDIVFDKAGRKRVMQNFIEVLE
jgi:DNA helicase-2/ATP-dependent DNA helicase PcrA